MFGNVLKINHSFPVPFRLLVLIVSVAAVCGCSSTYNITVGMSKSMRLPSGIYPTFEVDIVGLTETEKPRLDSFSVDEYFMPGNTFRENAQKYTMHFSNSMQGPYSLKEDNPIWQKWLARGITSFTVISNIPGVWKVEKGAADPRRLTLPTDKSRWPDGKNIKIQINSGGLTLLSPLLPPGKKKSWW